MTLAEEKIACPTLAPSKVRAEPAEGQTGGLSKTLAPWTLTLILVVVVCTMLALDASTTPEVHIAILQQSGVFP